MNYLLANTALPVRCRSISSCRIICAEGDWCADVRDRTCLPWWQWAILAAVPPAIVLLYFLKLKRQPLEVPSTYLWHKSIEDLHVNSIWQRLRQSLLLLLQLLLVLLAIVALLRPGWMGSGGVPAAALSFLVDNSASMGADRRETYAAGRSQAPRGRADRSDGFGRTWPCSSAFPTVPGSSSSFTDNRRELRRRLDEILQTNRSTSLGEALRVAAGLANPGREFEIQNNQVAEGMPAKLYIFSDGRFPDVEGFSLGNLEPVYFCIGRDDVENIGITAFSTRRVEGKEDQLQAFARLENCGSVAVKADVELTLDGSLVDADKVDLKARGSGAVVFNLSDIHTGTLALHLRSGGALKADDQAWAAVNPPRHSRVLLVTPGNETLHLALTTERALELAEVSLAKPEVLETKQYREQAAGGAYDFIIYDQCRPREMPQANTLFIGRLPPTGWSALEKVVAPQIIDTNAAHPIMQLIELGGDVHFAEGTPLKPPTGSTTLIESSAGVLFAVAPREGFEDAVLGVEILGTNEKGEQYRNTDWPLRLSFPVFVLNVLDYFGGNRESATSASVAPGRLVSLSPTGSADSLTVKTPSGKTVKVTRGQSSVANFTGTDELGIYEVLEGNKVTQRFAVNLFDSFETDIRPREKVRIGYSPIEGQRQWKGARRETWKALLLLAIGVLLLEWYIYNRRVYV
jgi:hypothetical protein